MAAKNFIVAIEIGSSKITGIAGRKDNDGSINVLAVVKENSSQFIRHGTIYNLDKTVICLEGVMKKLMTLLKTKIARVYIGIAGQSIHSEKNTLLIEQEENAVKITQDMVLDLMDKNREWKYLNKQIVDVITQEYKVDSQLQVDPVGIQCTRFEGNFLNILQRETFYNNLNKCFKEANIEIAEMFLAPLTMADSVLTENEKRSGCALIDIGAETTTVQVYTKNILRHLAVIPLGSGNITKDIVSLQVEEQEAERLKLSYGSAYYEDSDLEEIQNLQLNDKRSIDRKTFVDIVEARVREIIENIRYQIPAEYSGKLLAGMILTGGGSNMKNIEKAFNIYTGETKIRIAKKIKQTVLCTKFDTNLTDGTMNTVLGLLAKGTLNCAGEQPNVVDLFGRIEEESKNSSVEAETNLEEKNLEKGEQAIEETREKEEKKKKNKFGVNVAKKMKQFVNTITSPE